MTGRLRRLSLRVVLAVSVLVAAAAIAAWALVSTEAGLRFAWRFVEPRLPETLEVGRIAGRLRGPIELENVRYRDGPTDASIRATRFDWSLGALLRRTVDIETLTAEDVRVERAAAEEAEPPVDSLPALSLPVELRVQRGLVRGLEVRVGDAAEPLRLDSVSVEALELAESLRFGSLVAQGPPGRVEAFLTATPRARYPFELSVAFALVQVGPGPVVGDAEASGDLDAVDFRLDLTHPLGATAVGTLLNPLTERFVDARVRVRETAFRDVVADAPEARASGVFDVRGRADSLWAEGSAEVHTPSTGAFAVQATLETRAERLRVERGRVELGETALSVSGEVLLHPDAPDLDLQVSWSRARWPLDGPPTLRSRSGSARIRGTVPSYDVDGEAHVAVEGVPPANVRLRGRASQERIRLAEVRARPEHGEIVARGVAEWSPHPRWDLEITAQDLDLQELGATPEWPGRVSLEGETRGSLIGERVVVRAIVDTLRGTVRDEPLEASGAGRASFELGLLEPLWQHALIDLDWIEAEWGANRGFAAGVVHDTTRVHWTVAIPEVGLLAPEASGSMEGGGRITGRREAPDVEATILGHALESPAGRVEEVDIRAVVESRARGIVDVEARARGISAAERAFDSATVAARGTPESHDVRGRLVGARGAAELDAAGGVAGGAWSGTVSNLRFSDERFGAWRLMAPVAVSASPDSSRMGLGCWASGDARVCVVASRDSSAASADLEVTDLRSDLVTGPLPAGWELGGAFDATGSATLRADGRLLAEVEADLGSGELQYPSPDRSGRLRYSDAGLTLSVGPEGARTEFGGLLTDERGGEAVQLAGDLALPEYLSIRDSLPIQRVSGQIQATVTDFGAFDALLVGLEGMSGDFRMDLDVAGTVAEPHFEGEARLRGGTADVPELGLQLRDVNLTARARGREGIHLEGSLRSGPGTLTLSGEVPPAPTERAPARVRVEGTRVEAVALPEVNVLVSPELEILASPERLRLGGRVAVPWARVELSEIPETAVRPSRDVVFVGDTLPTERGLPPPTLDVRVELGDSVTFSGFGFSASPRGGLNATTGPGGSTTATGEITLRDGRYRAYGQELTMERGRLIYAGGPIENPGLDIRASRTARDGVVAGLDVAGTLRRPVVTVFSDPTMMESEALAYIVLGRPLATATATEGGRVAEAATALGLRGGDLLASRIGQRFGLTEVRIAAEGPLEEAALIAGKYLSPSLYVSYGVGLFEPISTFRLRYLLSGKWSLNAESGASTGLDVLYRLERGR